MKLTDASLSSHNTASGGAFKGKYLQSIFGFAEKHMNSVSCYLNSNVTVNIIIGFACTPASFHDTQTCFCF